MADSPAATLAHEVNATDARPSGLASALPDFELSLAAFPKLAAALDRDGEPLRAELIEFAMAARWKRAPRIRRGLIARLYLEDEEVPEVAVVRDISTTGVRVWVDRRCRIDVAGGPFRLAVKVPGATEYVPATADLVRVASAASSRGLELAFRFRETSAALLALADQDWTPPHQSGFPPSQSGIPPE